MHPGLITCRPDTTLGQVAVMLTQHHVHALIVADRDGRPIGIISDFDLMAGEWLSANAESLAAMRKMTAGELMTTPVGTIEAGAPISEVAQKMRAGHMSRLLVTDKGKPIGVIAISDLVASIVKSAGASIKRDTVADVMSDAMLVCRDKTPLTSVARAMTSAHYRSVLVVDAAGKPLGVVSGYDMLAACQEGGCGDTTVAQAMHPMLTIDINASLQEAANKMIEHHYHRLVVVDPEQPDAMPLGVISSFDIVAEMAAPGSVWQQG
jgi:CBS domain-containing protein